MISDKENTRISKFLSLVLRHQPEVADIVLDENGWTDVQTLIDNMKAAGFSVDKTILTHIVDTNAKKRFAFNETGDKIRASQGHSVEVELGYKPAVPPTLLYHGTGEKSVASILQSGLQKRERHHVHLSADVDIAIKVGQRHGKPFVFVVLAEEMHKKGNLFYVSDNGVWLTDKVDVMYLRRHNSNGSVM